MARSIQLLLVDESEKGRNALRRQLALAGYAVVGEASFGQEALSLAQELQPDLVLVSVEEPLIRALKTIESFHLLLPQALVLAVSSLRDSEHLRKTMSAGAKDYLTKPLRAEALQRAIAEVLRLEAKRRHSRDLGVPEMPPQGCLITVFGAKGGIGKTTLAVNLATSLAHSTRERVALVDLDFVFGGAAVMLDLQPRQRLAELLRRGGELDQASLQGFLVHHASGVALFALGAKPEETPEVPPALVAQVLELLLHRYDYVIVDTPPVLNPAILKTLECSTMVVLLTSLDVACVKNTRACLYLMRSWEFFQERVRVVINRANAANSLRPEDIAGALDYPVFWRIPHDPEVALASQAGHPLMLHNPRAKAARSMQDLLYALTGLSRPKNSLWESLWKGRLGSSGH